MTQSRPGDVFRPGDLLNNTYRIEALLGRGGTSDVYRARNEISGRLVALKALKSEFSGNEDYLVLLTREEEIRDIRHDAVVRYSENHRTHDGLVYLVMDYVEGPGLDEMMKTGGLSADDLVTICRRVSEGLHAAHSRNIVHRDLSPDNIILRDGVPSQAVIIDFGIAKDTNPGAKTIVGNEFAGKYAYAAPEQLKGQTDARSDIYSLGALLLAVFRGKSPTEGKNPMEVIQGKSEPLDTEGVPEPLKGLIDRMTDPDPDKRFQSAAEVLAHIDPAGDATVIAGALPGGLSGDVTHPPRPGTAVPPPPAASTAVPAGSAAGSGRKSRGGLILVLLLLVLAGAGGGGYYLGLFDKFLVTSYPLADPYTLIVEKPENAAPRAVGYVPSPKVQQAIERKMIAQSGTSELTLASGNIADTWGEDILTVLDTLAPIDQWRLVVSGNRAQITGTARDRRARDLAANAFRGGLPGGLTGKALISLGPATIKTEELTHLLDEYADCGKLALKDVPPFGYGLNSTITVVGRLASSASRIKLFDAIRELAGDREVVVDTEILNPTLCLTETYLPSAPESAIDIEFSVGDNGTPNPTGRFFVGENPVIDVVLPRSVDSGFLSVSILDVSGNVFHLLPNRSRTDNSVAALRAGRTGPIKVRVAYPRKDVLTGGKLGFQVDDSTLGKSKVIVIHSAQPLFSTLRPTIESAAGYAQALADLAAANSNLIYSLDSRIMISAKP